MNEEYQTRQFFNNNNNNNMNKLDLQKIIREEVKKTLNEGALLSAVKSLSIYDLDGKPMKNGGLQGKLKVAVEALEKVLIDRFGATDLARNTNTLAHCVIDIIDAARKI